MEFGRSNKPTAWWGFGGGIYASRQGETEPGRVPVRVGAGFRRSV